MNERLLVVGGGTMGAGIASVAVAVGLSVQIVETDAQARERIHERYDALSVLDSIPAQSDATIAIEAIVERLDAKRDVFAALAQSLAPSAILASNTSSLSVTEIAAGIANPERVLGLHFFNPPHAMKLVEIVATQATGDASIARARAFVEALRKTAILCRDTPGFVVNRVARPYYLQAMRALEQGLASPAELDALARGIGFRMGPFELMDLIGLDINLATTQSVYERLDAERFAPVAMQSDLVAVGKLGRKTGAGFYNYADGAPDRLEWHEHPGSEATASDERVVVIGFGGVADEVAERFAQHFAHVTRIENDDFLEEQLEPDASVVFDVGDGTSDRADILARLDALIGENCALLIDAYATDVGAASARLRFPKRVIGYGILGGLERQQVVEIVDTEHIDDEMLALVQEVFGVLDRHTVLVENHPALFLGRVVASLVNEAVMAVHEDVASAEDIDLGMRLGTNYPLGPIAWGREIGGARVARILHRLAQAEGPQFAPHRALWILDIEDEGDLEPMAPDGRPVL